MSQNPEQKPFDQFIEHQRKALDEATKALEALIPPAAREHTKAAVDSSIEGFRVLVNSLLDDFKERMNTEAKPADDSTSTGPNKVKVEVS